MLLLIIFALIQKSDCKCEAMWLTHNQSNPSNPSNFSNSIINLENSSELGNAISSLFFTIFGIIGITLKNYTALYHLVMSSFMIMGIGSFLHHYYYNLSGWAHDADIISIEFITSFSLLYIVYNNIGYKYKLFHKIGNLLIITNCLIMIIYNRIDRGKRTLLMQILIGFMILSQIKICIHLLIINYVIKYQIILSQLYASFIFSLAIVMWYIDKECPLWSIKKFNAHVIWHIGTSWSLFNMINISTIYNCIINDKKFVWVSLFNRIPWFLFIIKLKNEKTNLINNSTNIEQGELRLLIDKSHRRTRTVG